VQNDDHSLAFEAFLNDSKDNSKRFNLDTEDSEDSGTEGKGFNKFIKRVFSTKKK